MTLLQVNFQSFFSNPVEGIIYYNLICNGLCQRVDTKNVISSNEWNENKRQVILPDVNSPRFNYLSIVNKLIEDDKKLFDNIIDGLKSSKVFYSVNDVVNLFLSKRQSVDNVSFFLFMEKCIENFRKMNKIRLSETYRVALNSFKRFRNGVDITLSEITSDVMLDYQAYLQEKVCRNTSSFYMRNLRSAYNRMSNDVVLCKSTPFARVYTGVDKTRKRALSIDDISEIKNLDLSDFNYSYNFARDMFMFSFYTRGMSFIDMAMLKMSNVSNGVISYKRKKTGQKIRVKMEKCMSDIIEKYKVEGNKYLLPIVVSLNDDGFAEHERRMYMSKLQLINRNLKSIGLMLNIATPLTTYVARHSWASIAKSVNVPISVISDSMGHDSELTTRIYLSTLDNNVVDNANMFIISKI